MSTMVDRVARAILDKAKEDGGGFAYVSDDGDGHATFDGQFDLGRLARAAIEAMKDAEPTDEMMSAMWSLSYSNTKESFSACWHAMIQAALKESA